MARCIIRVRVFEW